MIHVYSPKLNALSVLNAEGGVSEDSKYYQISDIRAQAIYLSKDPLIDEIISRTNAQNRVELTHDNIMEAFVQTLETTCDPLKHERLQNILKQNLANTPKDDINITNIDNLLRDMAVLNNSAIKPKKEMILAGWKENVQSIIQSTKDSWRITESTPYARIQAEFLSEANIPNYNPLKISLELANPEVIESPPYTFVKPELIEEMKLFLVRHQDPNSDANPDREIVPRAKRAKLFVDGAIRQDLGRTEWASLHRRFNTR